MPIINQSFQRVGFDISGPSKYVPVICFIVVMIHFLLRYCDALPMKQTDSISMTEALFLILFVIKGLNASPWHTRYNELIEKVICTLKSLFELLFSRNQGLESAQKVIWSQHNDSKQIRQRKRNRKRFGYTCMLSSCSQQYYVESGLVKRRNKSMLEIFSQVRNKS